ncbi:uncharacterized protein EV422DRAFT_432222 [Fimicolochytrium jonesii]|uniref:uncharacterized protein n=1 Tax=Fimicolochytrium jonesii TaxID=1396493 RepID=UPI0022FEE4A8|nr:uncharacterized protein EV422DRAFT_432222 [Fimicolochytrium jonesii]KAI8821787.1 hypothetical protein EV422DRAFT_432222 [Fimicolochytrium jonesii]
MRWRRPRNHSSSPPTKRCIGDYTHTRRNPFGETKHDWDMETSERESVAGAKPAKRKTAKKRIKKKAGIEDDAGDQAVGDTISDEGGSGETVGKAAQKASRKKKISKKSDLEETAGGENAADVGDTISDDGGSGETVKRPAKRGPRKKTISKTGDLEEIAAEHVISDGRLAETSEQRSQEPSKKRTISQRIGESIQKPKKEKIDKSDQEETAAVEDIFPSMTNGAKPVELSKKAAKASG